MPSRSDRDNPEFVRRVAACIDRHRLLRPGDRVLVAVSGGADSVALLVALADLAKCVDRRYHLVAAHLDHGLRAESADDGRFVADLADRLGIDAIVERADVAGMARENRLSIETAARETRYAFLARAAERTQCSAVATAHHGDDNIETVLHRIIRGTGVEGLAGIRPARPVAPGSAVRLIRPMLEVSRAEVETFCRARGLRWRTDPTNAETDYTRKRIRHELLPMLRRYNPRVDAAVGRLAATAADAGQLLETIGAESLADRLVEQAPGRLVLDTEPPLTSDALTRQIVRAALAKLNAPLAKVTMDHIRRAADLLTGSDERGRLDLPGGVAIGRAGRQVVVEITVPTEPAEPDPAPQAVAWPGQTVLADGTVLTVELRDGGAGDLPAFLAGKTPTTEMLDAEAINLPLTVRRKRPGDRFRPLGAPGEQKLSDFFINAGIAPTDRRRAWVFEDAHRIVWVVPGRVADTPAVRAETRRIAIVHLEEPSQ